MNRDLKKIKKYYGEEMMHLCAKLFPTILEREGLLFDLLKENFAYSKFLYEDIVKANKVDDFKNFLLSFVLKRENLVHSDKNPFILMEEAGYDLHECKTEEEVIKFSKYYQPLERICTFYRHRTKDHYVFFAVKKDVEEIQRRNFPRPYRDDLYGTSVISIQFTKGSINSLSIKNRYNHAVDNPDATFSNNLDNIIPGLTDSFQKYFNLNIFPEDHFFELKGYCRGKNGKLYKYNYEINDVYYCANNIIIDRGKVLEYEKEKYLIFDYFIIDLVDKKIKLFDQWINDDFIETGEIDRIEIVNQVYGKNVHITGSNYFIKLRLDKYHRLISYESNIKEIGNRFLFYNNTLRSFINGDLKMIGNDFLPINDTLINLIVPKLSEVSHNFLEENTTLAYYDLESLTKVGNNFLKNVLLKELTLSNITEVGNGFMGYSRFLKSFDAPKLKNVGNFFLYCNTFLTNINLPNLEMVGNDFISRNYRIREVNLPKLRIINDNFLYNNEELINLDLPSAHYIGKHFLGNNQCLKYLSVPSVLTINDYCLDANELLEVLEASELLQIGDCFLESNYALSSINLENVVMVGNNFLHCNKSINSVILPKLKACGNNFLYNAQNLSNCELSSLGEIGAYFLYSHNGEIKEKRLVKKL